MERIHGRMVQKRSRWTGWLWWWWCGQPLEWDILESEVKWAWRSTAVNKSSWCDGIPAETFKTLKDDAYTIQYVSKSGRPRNGHRTGKGQSSSRFPRRAVLKNVPTIRQLYSSPMLVKSCLKSCMLGFNIMWTKNFQMSKLGLEKEEIKTRDQIASVHWIIKKSREFQKNIYLCFSLWLCGS